MFAMVIHCVRMWSIRWFVCVISDDNDDTVVPVVVADDHDRRRHHNSIFNFVPEVTSAILWYFIINKINEQINF